MLIYEVKQQVLKSKIVNPCKPLLVLARLSHCWC